MLPQTLYAQLRDIESIALARVLMKPVTWSRLSKLLDNREDFHQAPRSDCAS